MKYYYDYNKLKGKIKEVFETQEKYAQSINLSATSVTYRLNNQMQFGQYEITKSVEVLGLFHNQVQEYFFTLKVEKDTT